jgi:hypothetical protein
VRCSAGGAGVRAVQCRWGRCAQLAAIAVGVLDALEAVAALEAWKAGGFARLYPAKESREGFIQPAEELLQTGGIQLPGCIRGPAAHVPKISPLRRIPNSLARFLVGGNSLFQGGIVDQSGLPEQEVKSLGLLGCWAKEVLISSKHDLALMGWGYPTPFLRFNVVPDCFFGYLPNRANVVTTTPQAWQTGAERRVLLPEDPGGKTLELVGKMLRSFRWVALDKQVNVIRHNLKRLDRYAQLFRLLIQQRTQILRDFAHQDAEPVFWTPDQVIFQRENAARIAPISCVNHPIIR